MSLSEIQARLSVQLADFRAIFEAAGIQQHSLDMLDMLAKDKKQADYLTLVEDFGNSMAYMDHDDLVGRLMTSWMLVVDALTAERKAVKKRITALKEDKKSDPDVLARQEGAFNDLSSKRAVAVCALTRLKIMNTLPLARFKDPAFDGASEYEKIRAEGKK